MLVFIPAYLRHETTASFVFHERREVFFFTAATNRGMGYSYVRGARLVVSPGTCGGLYERTRNGRDQRKGTSLPDPNSTDTVCGGESGHWTRVREARHTMSPQCESPNRSAFISQMEYLRLPNRLLTIPWL
jgi:hypothetical protein